MAGDPKDSDSLEGSLRRARDAHDDPTARVLEAKVRKALVGKESEPPKIGRFTVLETIGRGGMGAVYDAYDPKLDRKVALKLLHAAGEEGRRRMLREARALARLSHPNVTAVYDAEAVGEDVYIAMELVRGRNLRQWREAESPGMGEILRVFADAGRGLAAAHEAGLVHGDFKPENVLIGDDGRVRVVDFGLARAEGSALQVERQRAGAAPITGTGSVAGTPAYMAPEQFLGRAVDARTDQFGFCVALYEALYGQRPFAGDDVTLLGESVIRGELQEPPRDARVRPAVQRLLERGLSVEPDRRWPAMAEVIEVLDRQRARRGVGLAIAASGVALVALALLAFFAFFREERDPVCSGGPGRVAEFWNDESRARLRAAFAGSGRAYAGRAAEGVIAALDAYGSDWSAMYRETCEASHVAGAQSGAVLDLRMHCLGRRLGEMEALAQLLTSSPDDEALVKAVQAAYDLTPLAGCADVEALTEVAPPPEDPALRERVDRLQKRLDRVTALERGGKFQEALALAIEVEAASAEIDYAPLRAESLYLLGMLQHRTGDAMAAAVTLKRALARAAAGKDDAIAARIWIWQVTVLLPEARTEDALELVPFAEAAVTRGGAWRAELESVVAGLLNNTGEFEQALARYERAYELRKESGGLGDPMVARHLHHLGRVHVNLGNYSQALEQDQQATKLAERALGRDHPDVADYLAGQAEVLHLLGRDSESLEPLRRALAIRERAYGPDHAYVGFTCLRLGNVAFRMNEYDAALAYYRRAAAIETAARGEDTPALIPLWLGIGNVLADRGEIDEALAHYRRALALGEKSWPEGDHKLLSPILNLGYALHLNGDLAQARDHYRRALELGERAFGTDHAMLVNPLNNLGAVLAELGDPRAAEPLHRRALAIAEARVGADSMEAADSLSGLGQVALDRGRTAAAVPLLERALAIREADEDNPRYAAETRFLLARALARSDPKRAHELAIRARAAFREAGPAAKDLLERVDRWLAGKRTGRGKK